METIYQDYTPKGVKFYYLYKALAHPELNGYVQPFTLEERLMHIKEAQRTLGSQITWICDGMDNSVKHALGDAPNTEFIIDPEGKIARMRTWSNPIRLRSDLEELVGPVPNPTKVSDLNLKTALPPEAAPKDIVPRIQVSERLIPVKVQPKPGKSPFYAKLRAEVSPDVLRNGNGKIYLGFHLDPLYHVHWNNLVKPIYYEIKTTNGASITPASGDGPKVEAQYDIDPREFLVEIKNGKTAEPLDLTVHYFACNDAEGWCKPVTQYYTVHLERDPDGGGVFGRSFGAPGRRGPRVGGSDAATRVLAQNDANGDGKLSKAEMPEQMLRRFDIIDQDDDGLIDKNEINAMAERGRRNRPGGRDPAEMLARAMKNDANGDGKLSKEEVPEQMLRRFDMMDLNSDGFIDKNEVNAMLERLRRGGRGRPGGNL